MAFRDPFPDLYNYQINSFDLILKNLKNDFLQYSNHYFNQNNNVPSHDRFFGHFIPVWTDLLNQRKYTQAMQLWDYSLDLAHDWEISNRPNKIHKGTPYYFLGVSAILNNNLDIGFFAMHQALKEDYRQTQRVIPQTPAFWFVSLDSTHTQQYFSAKVNEMEQFLEGKLAKYRSKRTGNLQLADFRNKFISCRKLTNEVFYFVFLLFNLKKLEENTDFFKRNSFCSIVYFNLLFNLCRTLERVVENKNPASGTGFISFNQEILYLSNRSTNIPSMSFTRAQLTNINNSFNQNFNNAMYDILLGRNLAGRTATERDFAVSYGLRNTGAHQIKNFKVIYNRFPELAQIVLNALFFTIENLY